MNDFEKTAGIVDRLAPELTEFTLCLHQNPELGMEEYGACRSACDILKKHGFKTESNVYGCETAFEAVYKSDKPGPVVAFLAEYDALPELGHGCGHNLIAMVAIGAGIAVKDFIDEYGGEVRVIGTPAEETIGGKVIMAKHGAFDGIDAVMMSHPMDVNLDAFSTMALKDITFRFHGKPAHAASAPHEGVNALDAVISMFNMINALRQQTKDDARIHGIITCGGSAPNIIPDFTEARFNIRANRIAYLDELEEKVINCAKAAAIGTGCTLETEKTGEDYMDTNSNLTLAELECEQLELLGIEVVRTHGAQEPVSSDFGNVSYCCPAVQNSFNICGDENHPAHTIEFAKAAASPEGINMALNYIKAHVLTTAELLKNPEKLSEIKKEFNKITKK